MSIFDVKPKDPMQVITDDGKIITARELIIGAGSRILKVNINGVFLGGTDFSTANMSIDFDGAMRVRDASGNVVILIDPNG